MKRVMPADVPAYVLPELSVLEKPRSERSPLPRAERLSGHEESFNREMKKSSSCMELPIILNHIEEGSLIITPGDRSDIILGSLLADASKNLSAYRRHHY